MSMSRVPVFAPCRTAALNPTNMKRTPKRFSASKTPLSPSVNTEKSSMIESCSEPLRRCLLQVSKNVVDASHVDTVMTLGDQVSPLASLFVGDEPFALRTRDRVHSTARVAVLRSGPARGSLVRKCTIIIHFSGSGMVPRKIGGTVSILKSLLRRPREPE